MKPKISIVDAATGEQIVREMNADEFAQYKADQAEQVIRQTELEAKALAKTELLAKLGITAEEAQLLLS